MSNESKSTSKRITPYQLFGWTPLLITVIGAGIVVTLSVISQL